MILSSDIIEIGTFTKTHGIKGELNALLDDGTEIMQHVSCIILEIDSIFVPHFITSCRSKGASASLIMIDGINSEIEAKDLVSKSIYVLKEEYNTFHDIDEDENGNTRKREVAFFQGDIDYGLITPYEIFPESCFKQTVE
ncbi:MAG: hypothetical protein II294_06585, partial [Muribaculaceae bacterium]|nr:hypothetical protein [Muribaculaceae bacterium]